LVVRCFCQHHLHFMFVWQVIQDSGDVPSVHLCLIDLLGAMIQTRGVT